MSTILTPTKTTVAQIKSYQSNSTARTDVIKHFMWFRAKVGQAVGSSGSENEKFAAALTFVGGLYQMIVVEAKQRKPQARVHTTIVDGVSRVSGGWKCFVNEEATTPLFTVVSGIDVRNDIDNDVITYSMAQALISLFLVAKKHAPGLQPAPLGMSVVCKIPQAAEHGWGIMGHGGLHFCAAFVNQYPNLDEAGKKVAMSQNEYVRLPTLNWFYGMAAGIDVTRIRDPTKADTLRAFFMATGASNEAIGQLNKADWGTQAVGGAAAKRALAQRAMLANIFMNIEGDSESMTI